MSNKRPRQNTSANYKRPKRTVDKKLFGFSDLSVSTANEVAYFIGTNTPTGAAYPGTITGLRWEIDMWVTGGTSVVHDAMWAIVVVPQGQNPGSLDLTSGNTVYAPEQNVLAWGRFTAQGFATAFVPSKHYAGSTKAMRKIKTGDRFAIIWKGTSDTEISGISGIVQFFTKT